jgi:hypothetical protein
MANYPRVPEEVYQKALTQLRFQLNGIMNTYCCYGLDGYVPGTIEEIVKLAEQFAMRVRGKDVPIKVIDKPKRRVTE